MQTQIRLVSTAINKLLIKQCIVKTHILYIIGITNRALENITCPYLKIIIII